MRHLGLICLLALGTLGNPAIAQVTVPHTFTAGTPASATEVNANFQALVNAINGLSNRVTKIEGTITAADIVGTYQFENLQLGINVPGGTAEGIVYHGTFVFAADGTFTLTWLGTRRHGGGVNPDDGGLNGTWSLEPGRVRFTVAGSTISDLLYHVNGGDLLVGTVEGGEAGYGHANVLILIRRP